MSRQKCYERHLSIERAGSIIRDYSLLTKPRIVVLAVATVAVGFMAGSDDSLSLFRGGLCVAVMGCLAAACGILNQAIESRFDAEMRRTIDRPICDGRVSGNRAQQIGLALSFAAIFTSSAFGWLTMLASIAVLVFYIGIYTPLKRRSFLGTIGGAVSGSLPPFLGWTASGRGLDDSIGWLIAFLFAWQFPHFLAISAVYEKDYSTAGFHMVPIAPSGQKLLGLVATLYSLVGIPLFGMLSETGLMSSSASAAGVWLSMIYLWLSLLLWRFDDIKSARRLMLYSLFFVTYVFVAIAHRHIAGI